MYGAWILMLIALMTARYAYQWDLQWEGWTLSWLWRILFFTLPLAATIGMLVYYQKSFYILKKQDFQWLCLGILCVLWANQYALWYKYFLPILPEYAQYFVGKLCFNVHVSTFYILIPWLYGRFQNPESYQNFYGFTRKGFKPRPYMLMLLGMLPLLIWASFQEDFLVAYPRYRPGLLEVNTGIPSWLTVLVYEASYVLQFVALEIFFRGFIVLNLGRYLGSGVVFPMVTIYMLIHFYKPLPETIGSILGGYTLGVIAWYSRSVWGGILVHIGIALLMEALAFWQLG